MNALDHLPLYLELGFLLGEMRGDYAEKCEAASASWYCSWVLTRRESFLPPISFQLLDHWMHFSHHPETWLSPDGPADIPYTAIHSRSLTHRWAIRAMCRRGGHIDRSRHDLCVKKAFNCGASALQMVDWFVSNSLGHIHIDSKDVLPLSSAEYHHRTRQRSCSDLKCIYL